MAHAIRLGIKPFAELGANSEALSGSHVDSPCSCRAIFESAPVAMLQSLLSWLHRLGRLESVQLERQLRDPRLQGLDLLGLVIHDLAQSIALHFGGMDHAAACFPRRQPYPAIIAMPMPNGMRGAGSGVGMVPGSFRNIRIPPENESSIGVPFAKVPVNVPVSTGNSPSG